MKRHDEQLWAYANKELELGEHRYIEAHLDDCPECVEQLAGIQIAKEALALARDGRPSIDWSRIDERIGALVEKRLESQRRPLLGRIGVGLVGLGLVSAAAAFMWFPSPQAPSPAVETLAPLARLAQVDRARGLTRIDGSLGELGDGAELSGGDVLKTSPSGRALVRLPDGSHLRIDRASQLSLTRSEAEDVALTLERGSLAVQASHRARKAFVIHSGGLSVNVVGTVFGVVNEAGVVEVSVAEGKVRVELPNGESTLVESGQRLRYNSKTQRAKQVKLSASEERELTTFEVDAVPPSVGERGRQGDLPRLSPSEARARQVSAPVQTAGESKEAREEPMQEARTELVVEAPEHSSARPAGQEAPPASQPGEWLTLPAVKGPPSKLMPKDLEMLFIQRAEEAIPKGNCERFMLGLEDLAQDTQRSQRSEWARVLRARCFDAQLRPRQAMNEYRKYLEEYPRGGFSMEARQALGD